MKYNEYVYKKFYILDTETTGLGNEDEIVEIAIIDNTDGIILNKLIKPTIKIPSIATNIHGITNEMVKDSPSINEFIDILEKLKGETIYIYNKDFDIRLLKQSLAKFNINFNEKDYNFKCAMEEYAEFVGEWNEYRGNYKWHKLTQAYNDIPNKNEKIIGAHRALQDCLMTLEVVLFLKSEETLREAFIKCGLIDSPDIKLIKNYMSEKEITINEGGIGGGYYIYTTYHYYHVLEYELNGVKKIYNQESINGYISYGNKVKYYSTERMIEYLNKEILHEQYLRKFPTKNNEIKKGKI